MCRRRIDAGQALIVVALAMVVVLGFLGLGLDLGYLRYMKRQVQRAADAAAIAGAGELPVCQGASACSAMQTAVQQALVENSINQTPTVVTGCASGSGDLVIAINNPPCAAGSADPHNGDKNYVEVLVSQVTPLNFATVFGAKATTLTARSEAALTSDLIYALDTSGSGTLTVTSGVTVSTPGGVIVDSSSSGAFSCSNASISAPYIGVVGRAGRSYRHFYHGYGSNCSYPEASPTFGIATPQYGSPANADPLYSQQSTLAGGAPSTSNCGTTTNSPYTGSPSQITLRSGTFILNPGTYCGGIVIQNSGSYFFGFRNSTTVTFNPGIYTLTSTGHSDGGLSIDVSTTVTGNGVGFYNYGPNGDITIQNQYSGFGFGGGGGNGVTLTAPDANNCSACATAWQGILFYQDPGDNDDATIVGSRTYNAAVTGTVYVPNAGVTYANDNQTAVDYNLVVAKDVTLGYCGWGGGFFGSNCIGAYFFNNWWRHGIHSPLNGTGGTGVVE